MPYTIPPGYRAVLLGQSPNLEELDVLTPLEESTDEGALILMQLDFSEPLSEEALAQLNQACLDQGIPAWPGNAYLVYADLTSPSIYLAWQKGQAWLPVIGGLLVTVVLPPLLGGLIWWLLPQSVKDLISGIINLGIMLLVMWLISTLMKPLINSGKTKPKKVPEEKKEKLEEAGT